MSKQLPAELKKKIIDKANNYEWEDNPEAVRSAYIDGATDYAELLAEAQGRIKTLEAALQAIRDEVIPVLDSYEANKYITIVRGYATIALSPNNKLKEDE